MYLIFTDAQQCIWNNGFLIAWVVEWNRKFNKISIKFLVVGELHPKTVDNFFKLLYVSTKENE